MTNKNQKRTSATSIESGAIEIPVPDEIIEGVRRAGGDPTDPSQLLLAIQNNLTFNNSTFLTADIVRELLQLDPDARKMLLEAYRAQQLHRHELERLDLEASVRVRDRAQRNALVVGVLGLVLAAGVVAISPGATTATVGSIIALVSIGGPVTANILASRFHSRRDNK